VLGGWVLVLGWFLVLGAWCGIAGRLLRSAVRRVERILILGATPLAEGLVRAIALQRPRRRVVVGVLDDRNPAPDCAIGPLFLGGLRRLRQVVAEAHPHRIVVAMTERRREVPASTLLESYLSRGVIIEDAAEVYERLTGEVALESLTPMSVIASGKFRPSRLYQAFARIFSVSVALVALVALAPVLVVVALAIKLDSPGPVLFAQMRVGAQGRPFRLLKFRTMRDGERRSEWEGDNRDHVTRVGRWLRRFRLDELPQFINILRGEMNLVGPRPHPVTNLELFTLVARNLNELTGAAIGCYALRLLVRPGLTGWAQVRYHYANNLEEEIEKLRYDLYYVKHLSPWLDLRILLETIGVLLKGRPSEGEDEGSAQPTTNTVPAVAPAQSFGFARKVGGTTEA